MAERPIRVLHVIDSLGRGGAEQLLVSLLPALAKQDVEPMVAVLRGPYDLQRPLESAGVQVVRLSAFNKWNLPAGQRAIAQLCEREKVDVVHAHLYFPGLYTGLLGANGRWPVFETFHNLAYAGANRGGLKLRFRKVLRRLIAKRSGSRFLAVSDAVAHHYRQALDLEMVTALPNAVDLEEIARIRTRHVHTDTTGTLTIAVPGRLVAEKGHGDFLEALSGADLPSFRAKFLGGGPLQGALQQDIDAMGLPVTISGSLPHRDFLAQLAQADNWVEDSPCEGLGIAAAEAMALGVPTLASDAGGLPEVVGDAGIVVPVGDIAALREGLIRLAKESQLRAGLGSAGMHRVHEHFSVDSSAAKLASLYRAAIAR